jgi:poly-beta-1,6-N-acetyl-D-glucosamine N-deacetylase
MAIQQRFMQWQSMVLLAPPIALLLAIGQQQSSFSQVRASAVTSSVSPDPTGLLPVGGDEAPIEDGLLQERPALPDPVLPSGTCPPSLTAGVPSSAGLAQLVSQSATWVEQPGVGMGQLVSNLAPQLLAYLAPSPFPEINARARQARVPVMMYHDILEPKQVFFDVTPQEFEQHLQLIQAKGLTPISMDQLVAHLQTGMPLPEKPILLTFDDGYAGHYTHVYPLLKKYNYPAVFSIYTAKVGKRMGRSSLTWEQIREMAADPLVTIASHSVTHKVMPTLSESENQFELQESKRILEEQLGRPIRYFTYPEGKYDAKIAQAAQTAGYLAALTMDDANEQLAGQSVNLMAIGRIGQSRIREMVDVAWGGPALPAINLGGMLNFERPIQSVKTEIDGVAFTLISGGKPITIHAKTRAQVPDIIAGTEAIAAVDGGFFSLEKLDSNEMLGPVLSRSHGNFIPGKRGEIPFLKDRPLVLISDATVRFIPFDPDKHNSLEALQAEMPGVTDAFVAAGWLVDRGEPQPVERFGRLYSVNEERHRAFWGLSQSGEPVIGVANDPIGSVALGQALAKAGFRDAVMLDSGASTSLAYKGESLVGYTPRPVPHVVGLVPTASDFNTACTVVSAR